MSSAMRLRTDPKHPRKSEQEEREIRAEQEAQRHRAFLVQFQRIRAHKDFRDPCPWERGQ